MLGNKLEHTYYWYNDEYMYFSFNGHHSSKYHLFIQNAKDLTIENSIGATSEYSNAMMQEGTYYLGTSRKQKTFKRKCAAELDTMLDYKRMMKWLTVGTTGELVFDNDRYWGWTVVLDTVGDTTFAKRGNKITVEFDITFKTIGTYLAHSVYPGVWDSYSLSPYLDVIASNQYNIPVIVAKSSFIEKQLTGSDCVIDIFIQDIGNMHQNFSLLLMPQNTLSVSGFKFIVSQQSLQSEDKVDFLVADFLLNATLSQIINLEYISQNGTLYINQAIAEEYIGCIKTTQKNGLMQLNSNEPLELYTTEIKVENNNIILTLDEDSWFDFKQEEFHYVTVSKSNPTATRYSIDEYADYDATVLSYTGFYNDTVVQPGINNIGVYTLNETTKQIIIQLPNTPAVVFDNNYVVHCGKTKHVKVELTNIDTAIPFIIKSVSYNNL